MQQEVGHTSARNRTETPRGTLLHDLLGSRALREATGAEHAEKRFRQFCVTFLRGRSIDMSNVAQKPQTFPAERYQLTPRIRHSMRGTDARSLQYLNIGGPDTAGAAFLDAPFAYTIDFKHDEDVWEPISIIGFKPDFETGTLHIYQVQGGNAIQQQRTDTAKRARMKFSNPEKILINEVIDLARKNGLSKMSLIHPSRIYWAQIKEEAAAGIHAQYTKLKDELSKLYPAVEHDEKTYFDISRPLASHPSA